ncbi:minor tail protein [Mycobacterium phage ItsyBitsy1]|uniref:Minor tail protein n=1 Tax=Mycobacterium phage ItsyBitsy1 TaxID=2079568 RepID=A0A2L0HKJ9_9CAUD|nr:minor tail protein [Mycobacterium phage ItsyBitsy1]
MAFRGWFALNGVELANSSRVVAHLGVEVPTSDLGVFTDPSGDCGLVESEYGPGTFELAPSMVQVSPGLYTPPDGARRFGPGLLLVGDSCWAPSALCTQECRSLLGYDDSWPGLREFLGDTIYRPELAPWYVAEQPESAEFGGVWVMQVDGLDVTPAEREIMPVVGPGGVAGPPRDPHRVVRFEALLVACTHAGLNYGLQWLACNLREAHVDSTASLRYLAAHPEHSAVDPASLVREAAGVVLTQEPRIMNEYAPGSKRNQQATVYRVSWELAILSPYAYVPPVDLVVDWHDIVRQPINWIHAADCAKPETCVDMPVMYSTECEPEEIAVTNTPPPVCGGCLPVGEISKYLFQVPTMDYPFRCRETAVTQVIRNVGEHSLSLQAFWRVCGTDVRCEDNRFPLQVSGMPPGSELVLDGVTGRYKMWYDERWRLPVGIVGTPNGAPWRPPLIDRTTCWEFVVQTATTSDFEVELSLRDREA